MEFLTQENMKEVAVDRKKLDRHRVSGRKEITIKSEKEISSKPVIAFSYDSRKDKTLVQIFKNGKIYTKVVIEDHYVMLEEPGNVFLGHVVPVSGHSLSIAIKLFRFLKSKGWDESICVIGADGCSTNTGYKKGALVMLEKLIGRPVHWFICMLHGCELPLRAVIKALDGGTSGPLTLKGPIGKTLSEDLTELDVVEFEKIPNPDFPKVAEDESYELSNDQAYLYQMCHAIMDGVVSPDLASKEPGTLNNARWLTLANSLMRKFVSTPAPSRKFKDIIFTIIHFYAPAWFTIKTHPKCTDGPKNVMNMIKCSKKLSPESRKIVRASMQRNGYFAHPEAILLAMLSDEDIELRSRAVNQILTMRANMQPSAAVNNQQDDDSPVAEDTDDGSEDEDGEAYEEALELDAFEKEALKRTMRQYIIPEINFEASSYPEMIDWEVSKLSEPPLTLSLSNDEILAFKSTPMAVPNLPCHTQAVERAIRLVTEASSSVVGEEARDGFIRQRIESRKELKGHASKKDFYARVEAMKNK